MDIVPEAAVDRGQNRHHIEIADATLTFRSVPIADLTPTGARHATAESSGICPSRASIHRAWTRSTTA